MAEQGLSQNDLAERMGFAVRAIDHLLTGEFGPAFDTIAGLGSGFGRRPAADPPDGSAKRPRAPRPRGIGPQGLTQP